MNLTRGARDMLVTRVVIIAKRRLINASWKANLPNKNGNVILVSIVVRYGRYGSTNGYLSVDLYKSFAQ
jgi:ABC-type sulfate transport system substrate-binding protein